MDQHPVQRKQKYFYFPYFYCNIFTSEVKRGYGVILDFEDVFDIPECDHSNEAQHHIRVVGVADYLFSERVIFQQCVNLKLFFTLRIAAKDPCTPNPCQHDGTCLQAHNNRGYHCLCHAGWRGYACERKYETTVTTRQRGRLVQGAGVKSLIQGLHPATCFSVVPSSNPRSRFVNSQLICLLPEGIFNHFTFI